MDQSPLRDRVPPFHDEAESAVLGALLLNYSSETFDTVSQFLRADDFYKINHQYVFRAIVKLHESGTNIDLISLIEQLKKDGDLDRAGGYSSVADLTSSVPTSANVEYYAKLVQDCSIRRMLLGISGDISMASYDNSRDTRVILEEAEKAIFDINDQRQSSESMDVKDIIPQVVEIIEERSKNKSNYTGIPSGFPALDDMLQGFQNSEMIILGARPSIGKTAFALTIFSHILLNEQIPAGFFSLEMSSMSLLYRMISLESRIGMSKLKSGLLKTSDWSLLTEAAGRLYESPIHVNDTPNIRLMDLRGQARRMVRKHGVRIIFIDYIALISPEDSRIPRHEQIAVVSRSLKALARELDIPIVALSQVGRQVEGSRPKLSDIRESGSIEQDADVVIFLHRERETDKTEKQKSTKDGNRTSVIVAKNRNGPTDIFEVLFVPQTTRFENITYEKP